MRLVWESPSWPAGPDPRGCCWPVSRARCCSPPGWPPCCGRSWPRRSGLERGASWPPPQGRVVGLSGPVPDAGGVATDSARIRATLRTAWPGVSYQLGQRGVGESGHAGAAPGGAGRSQPGAGDAPAAAVADPGRGADRTPRTDGADRWDVAGPAASWRAAAGRAAGGRGQPAARGAGLGAQDGGAVWPGRGRAAGDRPVPGHGPGVAVLGGGSGARRRVHRQRPPGGVAFRVPW